jgi:hypothetical protein
VRRRLAVTVALLLAGCGGGSSRDDVDAAIDKRLTENPAAPQGDFLDLCVLTAGINPLIAGSGARRGAARVRLRPALRGGHTDPCA